MIKTISTKNAPTPFGPYSQAIVANGFVFCSGQIGTNPQTGILANGVEEQAHQILKNLQGVLEEANSSLEHVLKTTIFITNISDFSKINSIYEEYFPAHKPARATVEVSNLPKGALIEIEAIAVASS